MLLDLGLKVCWVLLPAQRCLFEAPRNNPDRFNRLAFQEAAIVLLSRYSARFLNWTHSGVGFFSQNLHKHHPTPSSDTRPIFLFITPSHVFEFGRKQQKQTETAGITSDALCDRLWSFLMFEFLRSCSWSSLLRNFIRFWMSAIVYFLY